MGTYHPYSQRLPGVTISHTRGKRKQKNNAKKKKKKTCRNASISYLSLMVYCLVLLSVWAIFRACGSLVGIVSVWYDIA